MWIIFEIFLNLCMTLLFGYVYLSLFTAFFIGNIRNPVGFFIIFGLHIAFTILSIVAGFFTDLELFLSQTPFIIVTVIGVVLLPFTLYSRNKRENLQGELQTAKERIAELIVLEERQRIARDLHDTLGQKLSMIGLKSDLASRLILKNPEMAIQEIKEIRQTASIALKEVRELVSGMRTIRLSDEVKRVKEILKAAEIECEVMEDYLEINLSPLIETVLGMCLKEAINNVVKHSQAKKCKIIIVQNGNEVLLTVSDNGTGFDFQSDVSGNGLKGMCERLEFINGTVKVESNEGTRLLISVPLAITHQKGS
ncbi:sensor histidine kinase [Heyndrickxia oleronia]